MALLFSEPYTFKYEINTHPIKPHPLKTEEQLEVERIEKMRRVRFNDERGSAVAEFVFVALPLFLPALIFFLAMNQSARAEMEASFLARESVQAFTTGRNDLLAHGRVWTLLREYEKLHAGKFEDSRLSYSITCSKIPCISPGAEVELSIYLDYSIENELRQLDHTSQGFLNGKSADLGPSSRRAIANARGYVDKWNE